MVGLIVLMLGALVMRVRPQLTAHDKRVLAAAGIWFCGGYAITVWLPIRSSLYAVFPAVGSAVACATLVDAMRPDAAASARSIRLALVLTSVLLVIPVYRARDTRFVEPARVSQRTLRTITAHAGGIPARGLIVLEDESGTKSNFVNAFGTLAPEAIRLFTGRPLDARIVPPDEARAWFLDRAAVDIAAHYRLTNGRVERQ